jgi:hypothetical protein
MDIFDTRMKLTLTDVIDVVARHEKEIRELQREKDRLRNATPISDYEKNRDAYVEYLLMCVRLGDWHGVSDAANDLRVLEAKQ